MQVLHLHTVNVLYLVTMYESLHSECRGECEGMVTVHRSLVHLGGTDFMHPRSHTFICALGCGHCDCGQQLELINDYVHQGRFHFNYVMQCCIWLASPPQTHGS